MEKRGRARERIMEREEFNLLLPSSGKNCSNCTVLRSGFKLKEFPSFTSNLTST